MFEDRQKCITVVSTCAKGQITQLIKAESQRKRLLLSPFVDHKGARFKRSSWAKVQVRDKLAENVRRLPGNLHSGTCVEIGT